MLVKGAALNLPFLAIRTRIRISFLLATLGVTIARRVGRLSIGRGSHLQSAYHCIFLMLACHSSVFHGNGRIYSVTPHSLLAFAGPFGLVCGHDYGHVVGIRARLSTSTKSFEGVRTGMVRTGILLTWHNFLLL